MTPLPALSVRQPWAWLIVNGWKDIENRSRKTTHRGRLLIHAPVRIDQIAIDAWPWPDIERPEAFITGGIVGEATLLDVVQTSSSPWFAGRYGYVLAHARPRRFRRCPGRQGGLFVPSYKPTQRNTP